MGEAIISRATMQEEALPMVPGYHTIAITLVDPKGKIIPNWPVLCVDGATNYNYKTNEKGQTIFMVNSGAANIFVNNYNQSIKILDISSKWFNFDAPVGLSTRAKLNMEDGSQFHEFISSTSFELYYNRNISNLILVGGGGSGACARVSGEESAYAGGGGAGYLNQYNDISFNKGIYSFIAGSGGASVLSTNFGKAGGTSYIENAQYSAVGGNGGRIENGGIGGLGNGGYGLYRGGVGGENSNVSFAGGGGGGSSWDNNTPGGSPYGGSGGCQYRNGLNGSRGGGGGACANTASYRKSGAGGTGLMRLNIIYN